MYKFFRAAAVVILLSPEFAQADQSSTEKCTAFGAVARTIMEKRQDGIDMSKMMAAVETFDDDSLKPIGRQLVILAYSKPLYDDDEFKQRTISEFANQVQLECYKAP